MQAAQVQVKRLSWYEPVGNSETRIAAFNGVNQLIPLIEADNKYNGIKFKKHSVSELTHKYWDDVISNLCNRVLSHWKPEKIILNKCYCAEYYLDDGVKKCFDSHPTTSKAGGMKM